MKKKLFFLIIAFVFLLKSNAAQFEYPVGARSGALGDASSTFVDIWSAFNNQAGLAYLSSFTAGVNYENRFLLPELGLKSVAFAMPYKGTVFALSASSFGYNLYSENKYGFALAKAFGEKVSAGVQLDYLNMHIAEGYGNAGLFTAEIGLLIKPLKNLVISAHVFNPVRRKIDDYNNERITTIMKCGASYTFSEKLLLAIEVVKDNLQDAQFKAGLEYHIVKEMYLRAGMGTNPSRISFGIGLNLKKLRIDIASSYHPVLGYSPQLSLLYPIRYE